MGLGLFGVLGKSLFEVGDDRWDRHYGFVQYVFGSYTSLLVESSISLMVDAERGPLQGNSCEQASAPLIGIDFSLKQDISRILSFLIISYFDFIFFPMEKAGPRRRPTP